MTAAVLGQISALESEGKLASFQNKGSRLFLPSTHPAALQLQQITGRNSHNPFGMSSDSDVSSSHPGSRSDDAYPTLDVRQLAPRQASATNWSSAVEDALIPALRATTLDNSGSPPTHGPPHMGLSTMGLQVPDANQMFPPTSLPPIQLDQSGSGSSSAEPSATFPGLMPPLPTSSAWQPSPTDPALYSSIPPATSMYIPTTGALADPQQLPHPRSRTLPQNLAKQGDPTASPPGGSSPDSSPPSHTPPVSLAAPSAMAPANYSPRRMSAPMRPLAAPYAGNPYGMDPNAMHRKVQMPQQHQMQMHPQQMHPQMHQHQQMHQQMPRRVLVPRITTPTPPLYSMSPIPIAPAPVMPPMQQPQTPNYYPYAPNPAMFTHSTPAHAFPTTFLPTTPAHPTPPTPSPHHQPGMYPVQGPSPQLVVYSALQALSRDRPDIHNYIDNGHRTELLRVAEISMPVAICIVHFYLAKLPTNWVEHLKVDNPARYLQRRIMQLGSYQLEAQLATQLLYLLHMRPDIAAAVDERTMNMLMGTKCMQSGVYRQLAMLLNEGMSPGWEQTVASPAAYLFTAIATIIREHLSETEDHQYVGV